MKTIWFVLFIATFHTCTSYEIALSGCFIHTLQFESCTGSECNNVEFILGTLTRTFPQWNVSTFVDRVLCNPTNKLCKSNAFEMPEKVICSKRTSHATYTWWECSAETDFYATYSVVCPEVPYCIPVETCHVLVEPFLLPYKQPEEHTSLLPIAILCIICICVAANYYFYSLRKSKDRSSYNLHMKNIFSNRDK